MSAEDFPKKTVDPLRSDHFRIAVATDAYGERLELNGHSYCPVHLLQPFNEWAAKQFPPEQNQSNLLRWLEFAYERGRDAAKQEIRNVLGVKP